MLFGMFNLAMISYEETEDSTAVLEVGTEGGYKKQAIDCLVAADFANPGLYTIEALLLYAQSEWVTSQDAVVEISVIIGMIVRLAMRMGIHRDSRAHPDITPFQGEMRRRIWACIRTMDILYSFQVSLPAVVHRGECNCELPRNIFDHEFDENTVILPPSRPSTDITEVSYMAVKARVLFVFQEILSLTESCDTISVEDVKKYENALEEVWSTVPSHFRLSTQESKTIPLRLKRTRINLDRTYHMSQCILHRKFLQPNPAFVHYRGRCIDAAMTLLNHQAMIYLDCESSPSIYPQNLRKRHFATLTTHDFFVACMAIALDLHYGFELHLLNTRPDDIALWGYDRRNEMITALEISTEFWRTSREESVEAAKAYGIFSFILERVKQAQWLAQAAAGTSLSVDESTGNFDAAPPSGPVVVKDSEWPTDFDLVS
jgi:hypothetical protein